MIKNLLCIFLSLVVYILLETKDKAKNIETIIHVLFEIVVCFLPLYFFISIFLKIFIKDENTVYIITTFIVAKIDDLLCDNIVRIINDAKIKRNKNGIVEGKKNALTNCKGNIAIFFDKKIFWRKNSFTERKGDNFSFDNTIIGKIFIYIDNKVSDSLKIYFIVLIKTLFTLIQLIKQ